MQPPDRLPGFPARWQPKRLGDLLEPSRVVPGFAGTETTVVYEWPEIQHQPPSSRRFDSLSSNFRLVPPGSILLAADMSDRLQVYLTDGSSGVAAVSNQILALKPRDPAMLNTLFGYCLFRTYGIARSVLDRCRNGSPFSYDDLETLWLPCPGLTEQVRVGNWASEIHKEIDLALYQTHASDSDIALVMPAVLREVFRETGSDTWQDTELLEKLMQWVDDTAIPDSNGLPYVTPKAIGRFTGGIHFAAASPGQAARAFTSEMLLWSLAEPEYGRIAVARDAGGCSDTVASFRIIHPGITPAFVMWALMASPIPEAAAAVQDRGPRDGMTAWAEIRNMSLRFPDAALQAQIDTYLTGLAAELTPLREHNSQVSEALQDLRYSFLQDQVREA